MESDYTVNALAKYIKEMGNRGDVSQNTARNWLAAIKLVFAELPDAEANDVRRIDVEVAVRRYNNRAEKKLSGQSLKTYVGRLNSAVREFVSYTDNPLTHKPKAVTRKERTNASKAKPASERGIPPKEDTSRQPEVPEIGNAPNLSKIGAVTDPRLQSHVFILRRDLEIPITLPRDLTSTDVRRITKYLESLVLGDGLEVENQ